MAESGFSFDVFVSYHPGDKPHAWLLAERLRVEGLRVWFDEWAVEPGEDAYLAVERGLETSRALVLCLSAGAFGPGWRAMERGARPFRDPAEAGRRFVPVLVDECALPAEWRRAGCLDFRTPDEAAWQKLLAACRDGLEDAPPAPAPPARAPRRAAALALAAALLAGAGAAGWQMLDGDADADGAWRQRLPRLLKRKPKRPALKPLAAFGIELAPIPAAAEFRIGSEYNDGAADSREKPRHAVKVAAFRLAKTEVTQGQWRAVMGENPAHFGQCGDDCPVESVSFDEAQAFIAKLNGLTGRRLRLPSEAEWEYACLAGRPTRYCGGGELEAVAWHFDNAGRSPHPVGQKQPNAWDLHDMAGNVREWTADCWHEGYQGAPADGAPWTAGGDCELRATRGGSWFDAAENLRPPFREPAARDFRDVNLGLRLAEDP